MESGPADAAKREAAKQLVILVFGLITLILYMSLMKPDFRKTLRMRAARTTRSLAEASAQRLGHSSMGAELATGREEYTLAYLASLIRDWAADQYEKGRGA